MHRTLLLSLLLTLQISAAQLTVVSVTTTGTFNNLTNLIHDDAIPVEGSNWNASDKVWWNGNATSFTLDLGAIFVIQDFLVSLDNNDTYLFEVSANGTDFSTLVNVPLNIGEIFGGMDTFSSVSGHPEYVSAVDFTAAQGRYVRVGATGGDSLNSIGEVQLFGESAVPEPSTVALLAIGLGLLALPRKK